MLEQELYNLINKKEKNELFDLSNYSYKKNEEEIFYRNLTPISDKLIYRKERLSRNSFRKLGLKRFNFLNELRIFFYENLFEDFEIDIDDPFILKFTHHISLLHSNIILNIQNNLIEHLKKFHNLENEILTFAKLRNILVKDFLQCENPNLSSYTYYYIKNITKENFKELIPQIFIEEGEVYSIINNIITNKKINNFCLFFLLCLIYVFDTEANQKEIIKSYKILNSINLDLFKEKTLISNNEFITTTKNKDLIENENNIIEINYERIINKNWYLSFKSMDTENFSIYKNEEIIIQPNSIFEIKKVKKIKEDSYYITLYMKNNFLNDSLNNNILSTQMQIDLGICNNVDKDINEIYPGINFENVISLSISNKEVLKNNLMYLACMKNLRVLDLKELDLDDNDMEDILPYFANLSHLSYLNLSRNNLESDSMITFESIMNLIPFLEYINFNQNNLCDKGID